MRSSRPGTKSASMPSRRSVSLAHELAVGVDVVMRILAPPRVGPDVERLHEAVHVLGHPQLRDPAVVGHLAVAPGVGCA